jgi:hypothetical protein
MHVLIIEYIFIYLCTSTPQGIAEEERRLGNTLECLYLCFNLFRIIVAYDLPTIR